MQSWHGISGVANLVDVISLNSGVEGDVERVEEGYDLERGASC